MRHVGNWAGLLAVSVLAIAACEEPASKDPTTASADVKATAATTTKSTIKAGASVKKPAGSMTGEVLPLEGTGRPVTSPDQQSYSNEGIKEMPAHCSNPWVVLAQMPKSKGPKPVWTWAQQAMTANQQFKLVDGEPAAVGQVNLQTHQGPGSMGEAFILVARCHDGGTCNRLAAMYKANVAKSHPHAVCGKLPMGLGPSTKKGLAVSTAMITPETVKNLSHPDQLCGRLHACSVASNPVNARVIQIGYNCRKAPSKFKTACAKKYPCAEVMACLKAE